VEWISRISREVIWELIKQVTEEHRKNRALDTTDRLMEKLERFDSKKDFSFKSRRRREAGGRKGQGRTRRRRGGAGAGGG